MIDPFEVIPYSPKAYKDPTEEQRQLVYSEHKKRFYTMSKKVMKNHNTPDFEKVTEFLDSLKDDPNTIPTCLLVNSTSFFVLRTDIV